MGGRLSPVPICHALTAGSHPVRSHPLPRRGPLCSLDLRTPVSCCPFRRHWPPAGAGRVTVPVRGRGCHPGRRRAREPGSRFYLRSVCRFLTQWQESNSGTVFFSCGETEAKRREVASLLVPDVTPTCTGGRGSPGRGTTVPSPGSPSMTVVLRNTPGLPSETSWLVPTATRPPRGVARVWPAGHLRAGRAFRASFSSCPGRKQVQPG